MIPMHEDNLSVPKNVHIVDHPLLKTKMSIIRNKNTPPKIFRELMYEIGLFLGYHATACLKVAVKSNDLGEFGSYNDYSIKDNIALIPILRGGIGLTQSMLELIPSAPVVHIGIFREKTTLQPVEYYNKLPSANKYDICYILDPMIASGGTVIAAIDMLKELGVSDIKVITVCASKAGIESVTSKHPDVIIFTAAVDPVLNEKGYIIPGLGDAGDRLFSTL